MRRRQYVRFWSRRGQIEVPQRPKEGFRIDQLKDVSSSSSRTTPSMTVRPASQRVEGEASCLTRRRTWYPRGTPADKREPAAKRDIVRRSRSSPTTTNRDLQGGERAEDRQQLSTS